MTENSEKQQHWENIYQTKGLDEVSWFQPIPTTSLKLIQELELPKSVKIIDIGGGDSYLVDHLLELGYKDITVLDISAKAIEKAQQRLGDKADAVTWITADAADFHPTEKYDLWHDRAAFHFLTDQKEVQSYVTTTRESTSPHAHLIIGTFSPEGPTKCSGIEIRQYSEQSLSELFKNTFKKEKCLTVDHHTPFDTVQNFTFCVFTRAEKGGER